MRKSYTKGRREGVRPRYIKGGRGEKKGYIKGRSEAKTRSQVPFRLA